MFDQILFEIYNLLAEVKVVYPTPNRISLDGTHEIVQKYLAEKSGGDRMEALTTALFQTIGVRFKLFDEVRREKVNSADRSSGMSADIECLAKRRGRSPGRGQGPSTHPGSTREQARSRAREHISEITLHCSRAARNRRTTETIEAHASLRSLSAGRISTSPTSRTSASASSSFLAKTVASEFLRQVGPELDRGGSAIQHRRRWAELLRTM